MELSGLSQGPATTLHWPHGCVAVVELSVVSQLSRLLSLQNIRSQLQPPPPPPPAQQQQQLLQWQVLQKTQPERLPLREADGPMG